MIRTLNPPYLATRCAVIPQTFFRNCILYFITLLKFALKDTFK